MSSKLILKTKEDLRITILKKSKTSTEEEYDLFFVKLLIITMIIVQ